MARRGGGRTFVSADGSLLRGERAAAAAATGLPPLPGGEPALATIRNAALAAHDAAQSARGDAAAQVAAAAAASGGLSAREAAAAAYNAALSADAATIRELAAAGAAAAGAAARPAPLFKVPRAPGGPRDVVDAASVARRAAGVSQLAVVQAAAEAAARWDEAQRAPKEAKAVGSKKKPKRVKGVARPARTPRHMTLADLPEEPREGGDVAAEAVAQAVAQTLRALALHPVGGASSTAGVYSSHPAAAQVSASAQASADAWGKDVVRKALDAAGAQLKADKKDKASLAAAAAAAVPVSSMQERLTACVSAVAAGGHAAAGVPVPDVILAPEALALAWERASDAATGSARGVAVAKQVLLP